MKRTLKLAALVCLMAMVVVWLRNADEPDGILPRQTGGHGVPIRTELSTATGIHDTDPFGSSSPLRAQASTASSPRLPANDLATPASLVEDQPRSVPTQRTDESHPGWPGAKVLETRESSSINGLVTRAMLLQPTNFPHTVYVEEQLSGLDAPDEERVVRRSEAVASHLLVKTLPGRKQEQLTALVRQFGGSVRSHPTAVELYFVDLPTLDIDGVKRAQAILSQYPEFIEYAELDAIVRAAVVTPNDPQFAASQWGLNNTGQNSDTADVDIDGPEAWDVRRDAPTVIVAVVDSGIRYTHEDLAANMWRNPGETGTDAQGGNRATNGVDDDGNGFVDDVYGINAIQDMSDPADDLPDPVLGVGGHGTSVAGVIGAVGNNGKGIAGVAWKVQLMALKWFNNQGAGALSDAIQCIDYARAKGASIVNASWQQGGLLSGSVQQSMVDALERLRQAGIIFVASAGNDSANNDLIAHFPSNYPLDNMIVVAAGTPTGSLSRKSNFGERLVDIVAPGEDILTTTSKADNDYGITAGTSFAAPHISGMLAILKAQFPGADYRALISRVLAGADRRDRLAGKVRTGGFANLANALTLTSVPEFPEIKAFTVNGEAAASQEEIFVTQGTNVTLNATATGTGPLTYIWTLDAKVLARVTTASYSILSFAASDIGLYQVAVSNAAGVATLGVRVLGKVIRPQIALAVNAPTRTFTTAGNTLWDSQNIVTRDGVSAGGSGRIAARQGTEVSTLLSGPGKASFTWKVSSERNNDTLDLLIDDVRVDSISGEVDWVRKEYGLSPGPHELRWRYVKDSSLSKGDDKGYLDQFQFAADASLAPRIESQPVSQTALEGSSVFFSVVASGTGPLIYTWQKNGVDIANSRSNRLDLLNVTAAAEGRYSVIVSNEAGVVSSTSARLTVSPAAFPPRVTRQPIDVTADAGGATTFVSGASGTPPLHYQWRKEGVSLAWATNASLTLTNLTLKDSGTYSLVVSNSAGRDTSRAARLTVKQLQLAPAITKQPVGQSVSEGERIELAVEAVGLGPFTYQWTRNGQALAQEKEPELTVVKAQLIHAGTYQVRISSPFGVTFSTAVQVKVTVSTPPLADATENTNFLWSTDGDALWFRQTAVSFDGVDALQSGDIEDLQFTELTATVIGPGQVSFLWKVSSEFAYDFLDFYVDDEWVDGISGEWGWEEVIWNIPEGEHTLAWYYAKDETDSEGEDVGWVDQVTFVSFDTEGAVIVRHPLNQSGLEGGRATFDVEAAGRQPLSYHWFKDNLPVPGATRASLTLTNLSPASEGFYHVAVSNQFGSALSRVAYVTVFNESGLTDYALNSPGLAWTNFSVPWFVQVQETTDNISALQSGPIGNEGESWLATAVLGPGILDFEWKVSSEQDYDFLEFIIDDELWLYISGEVDWQDNSVLIPPGVHYLYWGYFKDEVASSGADAGWLDQLAFFTLDPLNYWKHLNFTISDLFDPLVSGDEADPDFDGIINVLEYGFGLNPMFPDVAGLPTATVERGPQGSVFALTYRRRIDDFTLSYYLESTTDLVTWTPENPADWNETAMPLADDLEEIRAEQSIPISAETRAFFRVRLGIASP